MAAHYFKIGDLSTLFHVGVDSIRYYEKVGLLHPVRNPENNYRMYTIDDVRTMNTIRELLDLGISTDEILAFEKDRNLEHVLAMLDRETSIIDEQIASLKARKDDIRARIRSINESEAMVADGTVHLLTLPVRQCMMISKGNMPDEMVNYQLAKFTSNMPGKASTIGGCDCYTIDVDNEPAVPGDYRTKNVFFYSPYLHYPCNYSLPSGKYVSVTFSGPFNRTNIYWAKMQDFMKKHRLKREGDVIQFCHIDRFETSDMSEYVTELQVLVSGEKDT